jgi:hypothetical protein
MMTCAGCGQPIQRSGPHDHRRKWCSERCRKAQYAGACTDCGGPTNGTTPSRGLPTRCGPCAHRHEQREAHWTTETVSAAIRAWTQANGGTPPAANDWNAARARRPRGSAYPSLDTAQRIFGSWNAAMAAAGLRPRPRGWYERNAKREQAAA